MRTTSATKVGCYIGYAVQAVINNLPPLLYVIYSTMLGLDLWQISLLITVNFSVQICVDLLGSVWVDKIGYRKCVIFANLSSALGLLLMGVLPCIMSDKFLSLTIATVIAGVGSGLMEVIISPIVEALPGDKNSGYMSILHSFYCWGFAAMIVLSTLYLEFVGKDLWYYLPMLWALLPMCGAFIFTFAPIYSLKSEGGKKNLMNLGSRKIFWLLLIVMLCAGASEVAMAQWASMFAELGLGVEKAIGDLLGPLTFTIAMGFGRIFMGKMLKRISIETCLLLSFTMCAISYLLTALSPIPALSFVGCALCGLSVASLWPGTYMLGAKHLARGGTAMFALFALAGDIGCAVGPDLVAISAEASGNDLKFGILLAVVFPTIAIFVTLFMKLFSVKKK